jgi:SAM-dependent methyltransferase
MNTFTQLYVKYYNLLYKDKNYFDEYKYILKIIEKSGQGKNGAILDIGCGTGRYLSLFKKDGFNVYGIDISESMIKESKRYLCQEDNLLCCKASDFNFNRKFDVIVSLFHVISYQADADELEKVFMNIAKHLKNNGLFIFDFWYGPAVLYDPPTVRIKRIEDDEIRITRIAEPAMHYNENVVDVNYEMIIENKNTHVIERINETHKMRYFFLPELEKLAKDNNLFFVNAFKWLDFSPLSENSWYGCIVLQKK